MSKTISITIPLDYNALTRASDMLHGLAIDLQKNPEGSVEKPQPAPAIVPGEIDIEEGPEKQASEVFADPKPPTAPISATGPVGPPATSGEAPADAPTPSDPTPPPAPSSDTSLDSDGLPWDSRIHAGTQTKLAKTGQWKKKRGVDDSLVEQVEAELKQVMGAPAPAPTPPSMFDAPTPPADDKPAATVSTFAELMQAITAAGIESADIMAAVNKAGAPSLPVLASRPDLIPVVASELGL